MSWYPSAWEGEYSPRGVAVELVGGPLDGRHGHVYDACEALWCARGHGELIVRSARECPQWDLPDGYCVSGRYVWDAGSLLVWRGLGDEIAVSPEAPLRSGSRPRFGALWHRPVHVGLRDRLRGWLSALISSGLSRRRPPR